MPRALESTTLPIILAVDKDKPNPPTFLFRSQSARDWRKLATVHDEIDKATRPLDQVDGILDALRGVLVGWRDMVAPGGLSADVLPSGPVAPGSCVPYDPAHLDLVIDHFEALELLTQLLFGNRLDVEDKKKPESLAS